MRIILISMLISLAAAAETLEPSSIDRFGLVAEKYLGKVLSKKESAALKEYFAMLGVGKGVPNSHVWNTNVGFNSRFEEQFNQNSCFRGKVNKFYGKISEFIKQKSAASGQTSLKMASAENTCISGTSKYTLNTMLTYDCPPAGRSQIIQNVAGQGSYEKFEPGWVWKIAQVVTGQWSQFDSVFMNYASWFRFYFFVKSQ